MKFRDLTDHERLVITPKVVRYKTLLQQFRAAESELTSLLQVIEPAYLHGWAGFNADTMEFTHAEKTTEVPEEIPEGDHGPVPSSLLGDGSEQSDAL